MPDIHAILISMRSPDDPMVEHERKCFREVAGLDTLEIQFACKDSLGQKHLEADLLFFGGSGAFSVLDETPWVRHSLEFFVAVAEAGVPAWASCFGYQGLALALGGEVTRDDERQRMGAYTIRRTDAGADDPLLKGVAKSFAAQLGHHDHVDRLPDAVTVLAESNHGAEAFRVNDSNFWGAQFHPELSKWTTYDRWLHYRELYAKEEGEVIDEFMRSGPETPEPHKILKALKALAQDRANNK